MLTVGFWKKSKFDPASSLFHMLITSLTNYQNLWPHGVLGFQGLMFKVPDFKIWGLGFNV